MFQYMLLLRGATPAARAVREFLGVSIHAPLARSNLIPQEVHHTFDVSIHAPLARSNDTGCSGSGPVFVSIHAPLARSNSKTETLPGPQKVSIHAPLARSNLSAAIDSKISLRFNTCSSCEEQLLARASLMPYSRVSIHAPLARSNYCSQGFR